MKFEWIRFMFQRVHDELEKIRINLQCQRKTKRPQIIEIIHAQRDAMNCEMTFLLNEAKRVDPKHVPLYVNEATFVMNAYWCLIEEHRDVLSEYIRQNYVCAQ